MERVSDSEEPPILNLEAQQVQSANEEDRTEEVHGSDPLPSSSENQFTFLKLPMELQLKVLSLILVSKPPITNPWLKSSGQHIRRSNVSFGVLMEYTPAYTRKWGQDFNLRILESCKALHHEGMKLLYTQNIFRFTRRVWQDPCSLNLCFDVRFFLEVHHYLHHPASDVEIRTRSQMIKKVLIQDSDTDSDELAERGFGKALPNKGSERLPMFWPFSILLEIERMNCKLDLLTFTLDEQSPLVAKNPNLLSERMAHELYRPNHLNNLSREETASRIKLLVVRGATSPSEDARSMNSTRATLANDFLRLWNARAEAIRFTGPFVKRNIAEDGSLIPDVEDQASDASQGLDPNGNISTENGPEVVQTDATAEQPDNES